MQRPWRVIAAALLLVIVAHAASPVAQPFHRTSGSAFSAATSDVSLLCGQRLPAAKKALHDNGEQPLSGLLPRTLPEPAFTLCRPHEIGPGPTGPPPGRTSFHPLNPRAPPAA